MKTIINPYQNKLSVKTSNKISKIQLQTLLEHIIRSVIQEVSVAKVNAQEKKRWTIPLKKEQTTSAAAAPVTGPNAFKKKSTLESATTPDLTDDRIQGKFVNRGEIKLDGGLEYDAAEKIAKYHWDIFGSCGRDERGVWNFKTRGERWCCSVGMLKGQPAILSITTTPGRLNLLVGNEVMPHQLKEMTPTGGGGGDSSSTYNKLAKLAQAKLEKIIGKDKILALAKQFEDEGDDPIESYHKALQVLAATNGKMPSQPSDKTGLDEMTTTSGGGGSSAGTPGYNIPGAWSGGTMEKNKKHIEVLGYTLTSAGKKEMARAGDKLYENKQRPDGPICKHCLKSLRYGGQISCHHCGKTQGDHRSGEESHAKRFSTKKINAESRMGADFDLAQHQHDNMAQPEGDSLLQCPECGNTNAFYTNRERNGRFFTWSAECPDCGSQWGDDNLDSDRDER